MSPAQAIRKGAEAAITNPWIIVFTFMFQGGMAASLVAGALWVGDLNRLVLRNTKDIAVHVVDKPHPDAEARLRVLEDNISDTKARIEVLAKAIHTELIGLRRELRNIKKLD